MSAARLRRGGLRVVPALLLGAGAAVLVSCGSSSTKGLIPLASSEPLQSDFQEVSQDAQAGNGSCSATETALAKTERDFRALPGNVDAGLRTTLREGIENLRTRALALCAHPSSTQSTTTAPKTTTTPTTTTPTTTTTTPTTTTPTTPTTPTTTTPPTTTSPGGPGGGGGGTAPPGETPAGGGPGPGEGNGNGNGNGDGNPAGGVGPGGAEK